ncbi:maleylpyruvate isomerase family mycothiol-dependent enzyme [Gordonia sp. PKS22-38]|uniref:Maleylpyruvate isomerase family mycothiol-dependent enzyme n=1 Tax=Gordonia prachuapensis TaxID=3115651 RepID=A0ABU7MTS0_9ACTN|nr:maleylpyruvate isomerase family mycothiol-dependent enzyme [Gordonia sp. PKS22-38]
MSAQIETFRAAADRFVALTRQVPDDRWNDPGLGDWNIRSLVGHTSRALKTVATYAYTPAADITLADAADYYLATAAFDQAAVSARGVQAGADLGDDPVGRISAMVEEAMTALHSTDPDSAIETPFGGIRFGDYVPTRVFELAVHGLDLARALGESLTLPANVADDAVGLLGRIAIARGDGPLLLMALTGREPLPDGYCVV